MSYRSQSLSSLSRFSANRRILFICFLLPFCLIALQLFNLTVLEHQELKDKAEDNLVDHLRLDYPRGNILDRNGIPLSTNRKVFDVSFTRYRQSDSEATEVLSRLNEHLELEAEKIDSILETRPLWTRHDIAKGIRHQQVLPFLEQPELYPGLRVRERYVREYTEPLTHSHIVGYTSRIQPGETDIYTRPRYLPDDTVGRAGLERQYQEILAGFPGKERLHRDARGRRIAAPELLEQSQPGKNLYLTIDSRLQNKAIELLKGHKGSIILLDVPDGGVRVLASRPLFNSEQPAQQVVDGEPVGYLNRSMRGLYPPGSTFKIVGAATAMDSGISPSHEYTCYGPFRPNGWNRTFWCAHRNGHGPADLAESIKWSCNVYYYELGQELGFNILKSHSNNFGFAQKTGIDLPGEKEGQVSSFQEPGAGEVTNLYIGQGTMLATPLQVARAYAGIANNGKMPTPFLVESTGYTTGEEIVAPRAFADMHLSSRQLSIIDEGLFRAVNESGGTAYKAGFPRNWEVCGKTGTAENAQGGVDAWFAGYFPRSNPEFAFVVHVENAEGHGGDVAAPLAKALFQEYYDLESEELNEVVQAQIDSP